MEQPYEVKGIWDNKGETFDRYSIHFEWDFDEGVEEMLICTSDRPTHPQAVFSRAEAHQFDLGDHLGEEILWEELPESVKEMAVAEAILD